MASSRALLVLSYIVILGLCFQVEAQFFTKSSSKSIPRMGRRSEEHSLSNSPYRRLVIDNLIDTYGPNLIEALVRQDQLAMAKSREQAGGELFYNNEQPVDAIRYDSAASLSRDERSSGSGSGLAQKDASLAMRALNINRYMQHLASGQPLMSYEKLISGSNNNVQTRQSFD